MSCNSPARGNYAGVLGDGSCFSSDAPVATCDSPDLAAGECLTMTLSIAGELNASGLGAAIAVDKPGNNCACSGWSHGGKTALFELIMRRHNQRLYRVVRAVLRDEAETEDVLQDAYVRAFGHLDQFRGHARFATWLTRIALHEALQRRRRRRRVVDFEGLGERLASPAPGPERGAADAELRALLGASIDRLAEDFRTVFVLRDVEGLSTAETAACLDIPAETVKTRLHRARRQLREHVEQALGDSVRHVFAFGAARCDRVVAAVLERLAGR